MEIILSHRKGLDWSGSKLSRNMDTRQRYDLQVPTLGRSSPSQPPADSFGLPPGGGGSGGEWGDAHAAASAAREYSQKAQNAADAAQRYASSNTVSKALARLELLGCMRVLQWWGACTVGTVMRV